MKICLIFILNENFNLHNININNKLIIKNNTDKFNALSYMNKYINIYTIINK